MKALEKNELARCPFCGSVAKIYAKSHRFKIECTQCNACMKRRSLDEALKSWNKRGGSLWIRVGNVEDGYEGAERKRREIAGKLSEVININKLNENNTVNVMIYADNLKAYLKVGDTQCITPFQLKEIGKMFGEENVIYER